MKLKDTFNNINKVIKRGFKRFPVPMIVSIIVGIMVIIKNELILKSPYNLNRIILIFALAIPFSLCIKVFFERYNEKNKYKEAVYYFIEAVFLIFYYYFFLQKLNFTSITRYVGLSVAFYIGFLFIPYIKREKQFEMYIIRVFTSLFATAIYSVVLFIGLALSLFTINKLLGVNIRASIYYDTLSVVWLMFFPCYFLSNIPFINEKFKEEDYPRGLKILILYIIIPLIFIYTIILYIYFGKIIITRQWPTGLVSHLVLWYSILVVGVLFFVTPIKNGVNWIRKFMIYMPIIIVPIMMTMFASMGIRVKAYGITENRYYVIILGIWVLGVMLYYIFSKHVKNLNLTIVLFIIIIVSVVGPLSSYSISKYSQNNRLKKVLVKNNMLQNEKIKKAPTTISKKDKSEIISIVGYFNNNHNIQDIKYVPKNFKIKDMKNIFGFNYEEILNYQEEFIHFVKNPSDKSININGYDYLFDFTNYYEENAITNNDIKVIYDEKSSILIVRLKEKEMYKKDLTVFLDELIKKYGSSIKNDIISSEDMIFVEENNKIKIKFVFNNVSARKDYSTNNIRDKNLQFYMLVKIKR
ncbi:DUF4153 domain-containing protein [Clostridium niameyense]|uniref:DUF4153 domain-containing protein n=1 Tax=Clostridium niameyense TaxID=1622073 RepID=UPI000A5B0886|nr:DUF4153 domain-containing protein [Clostridium niameyense]